MAKLVSKTYGKALFELAVEENKVDAFMEEVEGIQKVFAQNKEFGRLMNHPKILKEEKIKVLENVFKGHISDELTGFLALIISKDRYNEIDAILEYFLSEIKTYKGVGTAYVASASELRQEQKAAIEKRLLETTSYQKMEMHYEVKSELIGGVVIRIGDRVVDSSIKTKLNELTRRLMQIQLS